MLLQTDYTRLPVGDFNSVVEILFNFFNRNNNEGAESVSKKMVSEWLLTCFNRNNEAEQPSADKENIIPTLEQGYHWDYDDDANDLRMK